jgi:hypothetical protein
VLDYAFVDSMKVFSVKLVVWESHVGFECDRKSTCAERSLFITVKWDEN